MTWGKIASWGVAAAMTAGFGPAESPGQAAVHAAPVAGPPAGYAAIRTGQGMCLDDKGGVGRDGQPVQTAVPRYFAYLQLLGVGMTAWQLSDGGPGIGTTAASDPGTFTTTATMTDWPGCATVAPVRGPGALIMAWFTRMAS